MLLTTTKRKKYFKELGLGEYNETNILKMQKTYFPHYTNGVNNWDKKYGTNSDNLLRHLWNVHTYCKDFDPEEFRCECGGRYCTGYPTYMRKTALVTLQAMRDKMAVPTTVTSGMRCKTLNRNTPGSDPNSYHMKGKAVDVASTKTNTLDKRVDLIKWLKKQGVKYAYCNGYDSLGYKRSAPNMVTSIHFEVN